MKRTGKLIDLIADIDNIALAAHKAFRGKVGCAEVLRFQAGFLDNILEISGQILSGDMDAGHYHQFIIYEPKKRLICAAPLGQRIIHHAIMNVCHEIFDRQLIYDTYASRPHKGTHAAIRRVSDKIGLYKYFVKLDVRKFFDSIDHEVLRRLLSRIFKDKKLLEIFDKIIYSYGNGKGLPIGNLTSQYFANYYLSPLDHYMKEIARAPFYVRYMDDVVMMCNDRSQLMRLMADYREYAQSHLSLQLKPPVIGRVCNGIPFLGYKIYKERILMNGKGKRRFRKHVKILDRLFDESRISEREYADRLQAVLTYPAFADSRCYREKIFG